MASYKAKPGDTFRKIAAKFGITEAALKQVNAGKSGGVLAALPFEQRNPPYQIFAGDVLIIPASRPVTKTMTTQEEINQNGRAVKKVIVSQEKLKEIQATVESVKTVTDIFDANIKGAEANVGKTRLYWGLLHDKSVARNMFLSGIDPKITPPQFDVSKAMEVKIYKEKPSGKTFIENQKRTTAPVTGILGVIGKGVSVVSDVADGIETISLFAAGDIQGAKVKGAGVAGGKILVAESLVLAGRVCPKRPVTGLLCVGVMVYGSNKVGEAYAQEKMKAANTIDELSKSQDPDPYGILGRD